MALISMRHVSKIYPRGTRPALADINLEIERGDFVFLVGASGSGKSTLLSLLLREEEATDGEIHVAGNDLRRLSNHEVPLYRRSIGFVFQDYKLLMNKTVWQNVAFALEVIGTSRTATKSMVPKVLHTVGLGGKENNYPHELSGGEAQRVAIARAYVNHPQILLADEPTGNLDPTTSLGIMEVLDAINRTGTTVVMATHNEEIVNSMRKRVVELHNGRMMRDEAHGSYDSAIFFPDAQVEEQAEVRAHAISLEVQLESEGTQATQQQTQLAPSAADSSIQQAGKHVAQSGQTDEDQPHIVAESATRDVDGQMSHSEQTMNVVHSDSAPVAERSQSAEEQNAGDGERYASELQETVEQGDLGISRLAKSVHSGRTGRYRSAFLSAETTMTWGRGITQESDATPPSPPSPPMPQSTHEEAKDGENAHDDPEERGDEQ